MDDAGLVRLAAEGDRAAFGEIYDRYADRIHDFCWSILRDRDEAADAMQDTFLAAGSHLGQLRDPSRLRSWLYAIARNEALRRTRARRHAIPTEDVPETAAEASNTTGPEHEELRQVVWAAVAGLEDRDRIVLDLHLRQGLEGRELGEVIGITERNAWVLMHRIRQRLERALGALLVARTGRNACDELKRLLAGWDGTFSPLIRSRVARHTDRCQVCAERRRLVASPLTLLGAVPMLPAPGGLREAVLGRVELISARRARAAAVRGGLPQAASDPDQARRAALRIAVALLLVLGALGLARLQSQDLDVEATTATTDSVTTSMPQPDSTLIGPPPALVPPGTGQATMTTDVTPLPDYPSSVDGGRAPTPPTTHRREPAGPSRGVPSSVSTPADATGPAIGVLQARPNTVSERWAAADYSCYLPHTSTVSATVEDASGLASVTLSWVVGSESGSRAMSGSREFVAAVGPFSERTIDGGSGGSTVAVTLMVTATDHAGNTATRTSAGVLTLSNCDLF